MVAMDAHKLASDYNDSKIHLEDCCFVVVNNTALCFLWCAWKTKHFGPVLDMNIFYKRL